MSRMVPDRPLDERELQAMGAVIERVRQHGDELKRAEAELARLCVLARDFEGQILNIDTLQWERPAEPESEERP